YHTDTEPLEACLAGSHYICGSPVHAIGLAVAAHLAKLAGQYHFVAPALDRTADDLLIVAPAVHVGGIKMIDAHVYCVCEEGRRLCLLGRSIDAGQGHAAKSDRGDRQTTVAKLAIRNLAHRNSHLFALPRGSRQVRLHGLSTARDCQGGVAKYGDMAGM